ncbi:SMI1/KNR4 family protein [bacterium]|nr:SMI1/KNR4 family protein [bacterium]
MSEIENYDQIIDDLLILSASSVSVFGSDYHDFVLHPPVLENELVEFERKHKIRLPDEYRGFLLRCGRGGAGPFYGLFDFQCTDDGAWNEGDGFVGILANPFPYTESWNDLTGEPADDLLDKDEDEYERQLNVFESRYWAPLDGAIPICHLGCNLRQWLVISGPEAGHVWADNRVDLKGLSPLPGKNSERITFYHWYRDWLDEVLSTM